MRRLAGEVRRDGHRKSDRCRSGSAPRLKNNFTLQDGDTGGPRSGERFDVVSE